MGWKGEHDWWVVKNLEGLIIAYFKVLSYFLKYPVAIHPAILGCISIKLNLLHCGDFYQWSSLVQVHGKPAERPGRILCSTGPNPEYFSNNRDSMCTLAPKQDIKAIQSPGM
jgi:hypothetical protein